ncbi:MAG: GGDEF domain-containing protein [Alteromonadaceae bacterium]|nr:GGDEF domain-containing protein [Alteromonadaceae bacterium]MBH84383.1 GGDEF domain-containing protein [Alteromonadaceae bacterium]|tara:strand:+ start:6513 stop:7589 length:1077 start_codon:yes stop_codon:yes gene_type:complete
MDSSATSHKLAQPHRKAVLVSLLWLTIISGIIFGLTNISRGNITLAIPELAMSAYSLFLMLASRNTKNLQRWIFFYTVPFFSVMMFAMTTPRATISVFGWVLLVPLLSHLLHGRKTGLIMSITFTLIAGIIFLVKYHDSADLMQPLPLMNISILTICVLTFSHVYEVSRERTEMNLLRMARTDFLTALPNRAMFREVFEQQKAQAIRNARPLTLFVIDLDYFKEVNDQYGHDVGDQVLIHVARLLEKNLRAGDLACRLGGEEFGVLLPGTNSLQARTVCEHLRDTLANTPLTFEDKTISLTMSVGIAEIGADGNSLRSLLTRADHRLYTAKAKGRNRVVGSEVDGHMPVPETTTSQTA